MSKKNVVARVGNFEITKDGGSEHDYLRIKSINGSWSISHRDDSPMYGVWMQMCKDPEYHKGMAVLIVMSYHLTNSFVDKEFVEDFFNAYDAMQKRRVERAPIPTEEEEAEAIREMEVLEDAKKLLDGE